MFNGNKKRQVYVEYSIIDLRLLCRKVSEHTNFI